MKVHNFHPRKYSCIEYIIQYRHQLSEFYLQRCVYNEEQRKLCNDLMHHGI